MESIIDYVINHLLQDRRASKLPAGFFNPTADKLKRMYRDSESKMYSQADAQKLMTLTGEMCASAIPDKLFPSD